MDMIFPCTTFLFQGDDLIYIDIAVFVISLYVLVKSSELFLSSAEKIGVSLGLSSFLIGVTLVAIGTSIPELATSLVSSLKGSPEVVLANVVGSNIANICLIIGVSAVLSKKAIKIKHDILNVDLPFIMASAFYLYFVSSDGVVSLFEGSVGLLFFFAYLLYFSSKSSDASSEKPNGFSLLFESALLFSSIALVYLSSDFVISSLVSISSSLNIAVDLVAFTALAVGTSLPELAVSLSAVRAGKGEIVVGNVLGSNIFNTFFVPFPSLLVGSLPISGQLLNFGVPFSIAATVVFLLASQDRVMPRDEGLLMLSLYLFSVLKMFSVI